MRRSEWFVDKDEMSEEVRRSQLSGHVTEHLGELFIRIATGFVNGPRFVRYDNSIKEDLIGAAVERMMVYWKNINPDGNPVSYCIAAANSTTMSYLNEYYRNENTKRDLEE